jgi:hypothetical protein
MPFSKNLRKINRMLVFCGRNFSLIGQDAGLIDAVLPAAEVIQRMVAQAEEIITGRLRPMLRA